MQTYKNKAGFQIMPSLYQSWRLEVTVGTTKLRVKKERGMKYVVQPKSSRNLNAARKPLVVQLWASRYRELYPL
jgi:hypothetical protein